MQVDRRAGRRAGRVRERLQPGEEVARERFEVVEGVEVADEAEVQRAVVGDDRHAEVEVGAERHHREHVGQLTVAEVERELRPRHVGHDEVHEPLARDQPGGLVQQRGRREAAELGQRLRPDGLPGVLDRAQLPRDRLQAADRVRAGDGQGGDHAGDLVAQRPALVLGPEAHRDEHLQRESAHVLAAPLQVPAQREGDDAQHDVVDGPAEAVLDLLDVVERGAGPREAPVGTDLAGVVRGRGRRLQARPRQRPGADGRLHDPADRLARAPHDGAQRARELAGARDALAQRLGDQLGVGGRRPRPPGRGLLRRVGREEHAQDVQARDAVHQRVMRLGEDREAVAVEPLDEPHLPQRPVAAQVVGEDTARQHLQLVLRARRRQRRVADVVAQVEALVVDPARPRLCERDLRDALPVARHQAQARLDVGQEQLVRRRLPGEDQRGRDVHVRGRVLQVQERRVQRAEAVSGHRRVGVSSSATGRGRWIA